ncbi:MAG TPA: SGNH/GDSL hydrolase family protein [Ohtaekwangia sp.]|nr:SGNH/GDSL hydrolase family protein [Ohtaekwangia sp.]
MHKAFAIFVLVIFCFPTSAQQIESFFEADHPLIEYTGRIDFTNPKQPRFWQPGVYIQAKFKGSRCEIIINDQVLWGNSHNYISVVVDGTVKRIQTRGQTNTILAAEGLADGEHTLTICKSTESNIGYLEFIGIKCEKLLAVKKPQRKLEFIGNSITCGTGSDLSVIPCDAGQWYDQHNAYESYGPTVARALDAEWHLSAVSGIGLIHSCCNMKVTMPQVFDKVNQSDDTIAWDFNKYQPDAVTIALGQNDGAQDSVTFSSAYVQFIRSIRSHYPKAHIVVLTSPMADEKLKALLKNYLSGIVKHVQDAGDKRVSKFFFSRSYNSGCGGHPDLQEHQLIAKELTTYLKNTLKW